MNDNMEKTQQNIVVAVLIAIISFLAGIVAGMLLSPVRGGISLNGFNVSLGSHNGNTCTKDSECDCDCDCECECECE
ncbi:MAG: hypothetical protein IKK47_01130 [Ruminococcus sp.]|nr:hypothetical protein [Ruminococcus sp.]